MDDETFKRLIKESEDRAFVYGRQSAFDEVREVIGERISNGTIDDLWNIGREDKASQYTGYNTLYDKIILFLDSKKR